MKDLLTLINMNKRLHANIEYFVKHYGVKDYKIIGRNALVRGTSDLDWVFFLINEKDGFNKLLPYVIKNDKNFSVIEGYMVPYLAKEEDITMCLDCTRVILSKERYDELKTVSIEDKERGTLSLNKVKVFGTYKGVEVKALSVEDAHYIYNNYDYKDYTDISYIKGRIRDDISVGVWHDGKLIAWGMTHDEGSIGVLHVMESYRKQGLGVFIVNYLSRIKVQKGEYPFMHIEPDNVGSMAMARRCGYEEDRRILWISRK